CHPGQRIAGACQRTDALLPSAPGGELLALPTLPLLGGVRVHKQEVAPVPTVRTGQFAQLASGEHVADLVDMQAQRIRPVAQWHRLISPENGVRTVEARIPLRSRAHGAPGLAGSQERHWWRGWASPPVSHSAATMRKKV